MREPDLLPQQKRENPEPFERKNPIPVPVLALVTLMVAFGAVYIAGSSVGTPAEWGDDRSPAELAARPEPTKGQPDGAALYASLCVGCHQASGAGLPGVFPPLAGSEWVQGKEVPLAAILLHGMNGPITVRGVGFNGTMPAFGAQLGDEQIAAVLTYIRSEWRNEGAPITPETVGRVRQATKMRTSPFGGEAELVVLP